jgi:hypothetical protein
VLRVANGNTLINNWVGSVPTPEWPRVAQLIEVTPDRKVVWALRDWTILGPASYTQLLDESRSWRKTRIAALDVARRFYMWRFKFSANALRRYSSYIGSSRVSLPICEWGQ